MAANPRKYPPELKEGSVRLVREAMGEEPELSKNQAIKRVAPRVGVVAETLRGWVDRADVDAGRKSGTTSEDAKRIKELEKELREVKRANEILLAASSFFARELCAARRWRYWGGVRDPVRVAVVAVT